MTATVVAVILALFWLAPWQKPLPMRLPFGLSGPQSADLSPASEPTAAHRTTTATAPASVPASPDQAASTAPAGGSMTAPGAGPVAGLGPAGAQAPAPGAAAAGAAPAPGAAEATLPAFDIVRVEPTGDAVIAGRAAPDSEVDLFDGDTVVAHAHADKTGQFAIVPPVLAEGNHYLTLQTTRPGVAPARSEQGVAVSIAKDGATKPLVALLSPDKPAQVLSDGVTPVGGAPGSAALAAARPGGASGPATPVVIQSVQAGQSGNFLASGVAHPGSQCRVYLNGAYLADVTAGQDGKWSVEIKKGMKPGHYTVRADELAASGTVAHRAEVPFDYPTVVARAKGGAKRLLLSRGAPPAGEASSPAAPVATPTESASLPAAAGHPVPAASPNPSLMASAAPTVTVTPVTSAGSGTPPAAAVIADLHTTTVVRGDSLWRISRKMLGHGIQYTEIYASNVNQIRDPARIYPGQIFVVPSKKPS